MTLNSILMAVLWMIPFVFMLMIGQWGLISADPKFITDYSNIVTTLTVWISAALCFVTSTVYSWVDLNRKAWLFIGLGLVSWSIGNVFLSWADGLFSITEATANALPNIYDFFFIISIPLIIVGFYYLNKSMRVPIPLYGWIIGGVVLIGSLVVSALINWSLLFPADSASMLATDRFIFALLYAILYPLMLSYAVTMASTLFSGMLGRPWILVLVGFVVYSTGEIIWNFITHPNVNIYVVGGYFDLFWLVGFMIIGIGAYMNYYMVKNPY